MQHLKSILSSLAAKILIVPLAPIYVMMTHMIPIGYSDVETRIHTVYSATSWALGWIMLSQILIIGAPYLIDRRLRLRVCAIVVYTFSIVVPILYLFFYVVDGVYELTTGPFFSESVVLLGVVVTILYLIALMTSSSEASPESIDRES